MKNVRVWFEKQGAVQYISHLDLTRCMARGLKLSGLPVWYTEGFNPRIYMTFAMPLSLGACGARECMDIRLIGEVPCRQVADRLGEHLPADLRILEAAEPVYAFEEIRFAEYVLTLEAEDLPVLETKLRSLLDREAIVVSKHTKKGDRDFDIKPDFSQVRLSRKGGILEAALRLPCSMQGSTNPVLLLEALKRYEEEEPFCTVLRKRLLLQDFSEFR